MRKFVVMAFVAAAAMGFGCALTNYELITDNDFGGTVNTNGKAYVRQFSQVATEWPDGVDNFIWFADQKANGDRTLAERITRTNMKSLAYWQAHPFDGLNGPEATEEEFTAAMAKL